MADINRLGMTLHDLELPKFSFIVPATSQHVLPSCRHAPSPLGARMRPFTIDLVPSGEMQIECAEQTLIQS